MNYYKKGYSRAGWLLRNCAVVKGGKGLSIKFQ